MLERGLWAEPGGAYAIIALLVLALFGAAISPGGLRNRARLSTRLIGAAVLVGAAMSLLWPQLRSGAAFTVEPTVPAPFAVVGVWVDGTDTVHFDSLGSYRCSGDNCTGMGTKGTWTLGRDGALVARWNDGHEVPWRVVTYNGHHRLALLPLPPEGNGWEGRLLYRRVDE